MPSQPTFANKVDRIIQDGERINLVIADDMNQLKQGILALYAMFQTVQVRVCVKIAYADFTGPAGPNPYYQNPNLIGLVPDIDFRVFTNGGTGGLLRWDEDGYDPEGGYGITDDGSGKSLDGKLFMPPGYPGDASSYSIEMYLPVTAL